MTEFNEKALPASSILGGLHAAIDDAVSGHGKILPVGVIDGLYCEYEALSDEKVDGIRKAAKARARMLARTTRDGDGEDPEGERMAYAQLLARACIQIMVPTADGYEPLHVALAREGVDCPPLRYNADLIAVLAQAGEVPGGLTDRSESVDIVRVLHRRGESSGPLLTQGALYDAWRSGVTRAVIAETVGE